MKSSGVVVRGIPTWLAAQMACRRARSNEKVVSLLAPVIVGDRASFGRISFSKVVNREGGRRESKPNNSMVQRYWGSKYGGKASLPCIKRVAPILRKMEDEWFRIVAVQEHRQ